MIISEVWKFCLQMWDDIFDRPGDAYKNKTVWMEENGFKGVKNDCFFCQFALDEYLKPENHGCMCDFCPGYLVDPKFDCTNNKYHYADNPKEFRKILYQLNKKRIGGMV